MLDDSETRPEPLDVYARCGRGADEQRGGAVRTAGGTIWRPLPTLPRTRGRVGRGIRKAHGEAGLWNEC